MKKSFITFFALAMASIPGMLYASPTKESKSVRDIITKVNNHWQASNPAESRSFWDNAAYHTGNMEAYFLTGNEDWLDYSQKWAEYNDWKGATV